LTRIVAELRRRHPELEPADDIALRVSDYTFDIGEHRSVEPQVVRAARETARSLGAATLASSVHLHVSLDRADKASGTLRLLRRQGANDPFECLSHYAFIGDSENDAACFAAFRLTLGVRNQSGRPSIGPRFVTRGERAQGFVEAAELLLARRAKLR
jgi:hydroxymethylpyrimidine pyrophosphatase-like HAD family hydrolase